MCMKPKVCDSKQADKQRTVLPVKLAVCSGQRLVVHSFPSTNPVRFERLESAVCLLDVATLGS